MASRTATVAQAVVDAINEAAADPATFGATFVARRVYAPVEPTEERALAVTVWCPGDTMTSESRVGQAYEVPVLVAVRKALTSGCDPSDDAGNAEMDALMELAERVAGHVNQRSGPVGGALWTSTDLSLGNPDAMRERRQFFAVATLRFTLHTRITP